MYGRRLLGDGRDRRHQRGNRNATVRIKNATIAPTTVPTSCNLVNGLEIFMSDWGDGEGGGECEGEGEGEDVKNGIVDD